MVTTISFPKKGVETTVSKSKGCQSQSVIEQSKPSRSNWPRHFVLQCPMTDFQPALHTIVGVFAIY